MTHRANHPTKGSVRAHGSSATPPAPNPPPLSPSPIPSAPAPSIEARQALAEWIRPHWLLTAAFGHRRQGLIVDAVTHCGLEPPLICVAATKGHPIEPLIRDSHRFAVCLLDPADRVLHRRFQSARTPEEFDDPFEGLAVHRLVTGAPVLASSVTAFDCDIHRHLDIDSDRQLYVGLVLAGRVDGRPIIPRPPPEDAPRPPDPADEQGPR